MDAKRQQKSAPQQAETVSLSPKDRELINAIQQDFPICDDPFQLIAAELNRSKAELISRVKELKALGVFSRFGGVLNHQKVGCSLLAAMKVPDDDIDEVARIINEHPQVNHNYLRQHRFNLWFVVTAECKENLKRVIAQIEKKSGHAVMQLPMVRPYHINLAFDL